MRLDKLTGAFVWKASDLARREEWHHVFSDAELLDIDAALKQARASGKKLTEMTQEDFSLTILADSVPRWMEILNHGSGLLNLQGIPIDKYSAEDMSIIHWGIGTHVGTGVSQNAAGDLLSHIRDIGVNAHDRDTRLYKTNAELGFHSDGSDIVALMCLKQSPWGGSNRIVSCAAIYNELLDRRPDLVPLLYQPFYWDNHNQQSVGQDPYFQMPICTYKNSLFRFFYIGWYIRNAQRFAAVPRLSADQVQLLNLIDEISYDPEFYVEFRQSPGDINYLKNASVLHMRTSFEDYPEPDRKRHLVRMWLTAHGHWADSDAFLQRGIPVKTGVVSDAENIAISDVEGEIPES